MIFVSTSGIRAEKIKDSVEILAKSGFRNIELSGGTQYYDGFEKDLVVLKEKFDLHLRCHNYFPPPQKHFVLNLSSPNIAAVNNSISYIKGAMDLSKRLGSNKYAFHAGFLMEVQVDELGKKISKRATSPRSQSAEEFVKLVNMLCEHDSSFELYVENNVLSQTNYQSYEHENPFLMVQTSEILPMIKKMKAKLLLDVAHLKVSCQTLNLSFKQEFSSLLGVTDYLHLSDNDGTEDSNETLLNGDVLQSLTENKGLLIGKDFTLEIYSGLDDIEKSYRALEKILS